MATGFVYLFAIMDWYSRKVLAWRVRNTLWADFCVATTAAGATTCSSSDCGDR
jgi:putative transposase